MTKKTDKEILEHNAVVTDMQNEAGEHPIGHVVHISTATHAFRGRLTAVTASHYLLEEAQLIALTGDMAVYTKSSTSKPGEAGEPVHCALRIPRSAVCWELVW